MTMELEHEASCGWEDSGSLVLRGPTIPVRISVGDDDDDRDDTYPALVDTGASLDAIDSELAALLGLPVVDEATVVGSNGPHTVTVHLGRIVVPELRLSRYGRFHAVHLSAGGQEHRALLGRRFLSVCRMTYDGRTGEVVLTRPHSTISVSRLDDPA